MKIAIAKEHRDFFKKNRWIELEDLITDQQVHLLNYEINQTLSERLAIPLNKLSFASDEKVFMQGRDLWRSNDALRKLICQPRIGEIVSELVEVKPIRIGYDQYIPAVNPTKIAMGQAGHFAGFVNRQITLDDMSCLKGIAAGLLICLNEPSDLVYSEELDVFPAQPGRVIVLNPQLTIDFARLLDHPKQSYYLVVYTLSSCYYVLQSNDAHTHSLKKEGYIYNDKLSEKNNPIIYR